MNWRDNDVTATVLGYVVPGGGAVVAAVNQAPWYATLGPIVLSVLFAAFREWVASKSREKALQAAFNELVQEVTEMRIEKRLTVKARGCLGVCGGEAGTKAEADGAEDPGGDAGGSNQPE